MNRHPWRAIAAALAAGALAPAAATASPPVSWTNVPSANPKTAGASPANVLSPELTETAVAWGSLALDGGTSAVPYYGYDGFTAPPVLTQTSNEAHKTEPDKNTYLRPATASRAPTRTTTTARTSSTRATRAARPATSRASTSTPIGAHRVTLLRPDARRRPARHRRLDLGPVHPAPAVHRGEQQRAATSGRRTLGYPVDGHRHLGLARPRRLRGHPERHRRQRLDRRGRRRSAGNAEHARQAAQLLRLPLRPRRQERPDQGRQAAGAAGHLEPQRHPDRVPRRAGRRRHHEPGHARSAHATGSEFKTRWVTIHDTDTDGTTPFDANALAKAAKATPFKRPENGVFRAGRPASSEFFFTETGDTNSRTEAGGAYGGFGSLQSSPRRIRRRRHRAPSRASGRATSSTPASTTSPSSTADRRRGRRGRAATACTASATRWTPRTSLDVDGGLREPAPARAVPRRGPRRVGDVRRRAWPATATTATTRSPASTSPTATRRSRGCSAPRCPTPFSNGWRMFWTQQHGDNNTYEVSPAP